MDDLLAKLRAAKPEARDQRDRRRRARLKDRYQDRVASGQKMPELDELVRTTSKEGEEGLLSPGVSEGGMSVGSESTQPNSAGLSIEEEEDVADHAAKLLEGLGGGEDDLIPVPRESIRMSRRRKEGAEDERSQRRRRRQLALSASEASLENHAHSRDSVGTGTGSIREEGEDERQQEEEEGGETPKANGVILVSPPSPTLMDTPSKAPGNGILTPPGD
jgi:cytokinesis protein